MRCLYCGKELALLKRWTGGGEFCSDAHRQQYQEEYNQLALNRLLQAKPPSDALPSAEAKTVPAKPPVAAEPVREISYSAPTAQAEPYKAPEKVRREIPAAVAVREVESAPSIMVAPAMAIPVLQETVPEPEAVAPAELAGFFVEMPVFSLAEVAVMAHPDMEFLDSAAASLPNHSFAGSDSQQDVYQLDTAGLLPIQPSNRVSNHSANGTRERRLEVRDFVRATPIVKITMRLLGETGLETSSEPMDILIFPQPPQGLPVLWSEPSVGFVPTGTELGDLARLSFATTGFSDQDLSRDVSKESDKQTAVAVAEHPAPEVPSEEVPEVLLEVAPVEVVAEVLPEPIVEAVVEPEPVVEEVAVEPVLAPVVAPVVEPLVEQVVEPVIEQAAEPVVEQRSPVSEAATTPLPLKPQFATPGKAKPVQVFSSASNTVGLQIPRSTSLPLRPIMTFGPAPVKEVQKPEVEKPVEKKLPERVAPAIVKNEVKAEPKKPVMAPAPVRPDPRLANGKLRRPVPEVQEEKKLVAVKAPEPEPVRESAPALKPVSKADFRQDRKPEVRDTVKLREEPKSGKPAEPFSAPFPAPLAAPYPGSSDLGLPRLSVESQGFWGRLPIVAKIGLAVVLVAGIGGLIAFSSKSGDAAVTSGAGTIVAGSALPTGDAGWITDWGADPGVRRTRQISVLRSSQTLTDYRIEMQGQIETKAIGWVFRAADPKNFYVTKLEIVKPGLEPTVALVRFAVINGEEQAHAQLPLPLKVRRDTMYKIRFDAVGNRFTTYVQDEKVDQWTDDHVKTGGVGLYSERGEVATLKGGMSVVPLIIRK